MCGLFGFSGKFPADEGKLRFLAYLNEERGAHSTGIFSVSLDKKKTETLYKKQAKASEFITTPGFSESVRGCGTIIGHTRQATVGAITEENAHPFAYGDVVGAHNGFVLQDLADEFIGDDKIFKKPFEVDSQLIFALLDHYKGDYNVLSKLEGAITTSFIVHNKYPNAIHLYRRLPRELHIGYAKEGIYYSSSRVPLTLIGCTNIIEILDSYMFILKEGEILDMKQLALPKIKSLKLNDSRTNWEWGIPQAELDQYPQLQKKSVTKYYNDYGFSKIDKHKRTTIKSLSSSSTDYTDMDDIVASIVKDISTEVDQLTIDVPSYMLNDAWDSNDFSCCLVAIKLISDVDNAPLPGFVIFDKLNPINYSITSLLGVTILKFKDAECEADIGLIIKDPIDGQSLFSHTIKPMKGRVLEVALRLPFREEEQKQSSSATSKAKGDIKNFASKRHKDVISVQPTLDELHGGILGSEDRNSGAIQGPKEQIHIRSKEQSLYGNEEPGTGDLKVISDTFKGGGGNEGLFSKKELSAINIILILQEESSMFKFKTAIKKLLNTSEYTYAANTIHERIGSALAITRLLNDACTLKLYFKDKRNINMSTLFYTAHILAALPTAYNVPNTPAHYKDNIEMFVHTSHKLELLKKSSQMGMTMT